MATNTMPTSPNAPDNFFNVAPSDTVLLQGFKKLRVGRGGDLVIKGAGPDAMAVTIIAGDGEYVPFGAGYVMVATTAADIVAFGN